MQGLLQNEGIKILDLNMYRPRPFVVQYPIWFGVTNDHQIVSSFLQHQLKKANRIRWSADESSSGVSHKWTSFNLIYYSTVDILQVSCPWCRQELSLQCCSCPMKDASAPFISRLRLIIVRSFFSEIVGNWGKIFGFGRILT